MTSYLEELRGYDRVIAEKGGPYQDVNQMFVYFTLRRGIEFAKSEVEFCDWAIAEIDRHRELFEIAPQVHPPLDRNREGVASRLNLK